MSHTLPAARSESSDRSEVSTVSDKSCDIDDMLTSDYYTPILGQADETPMLPGSVYRTLDQHGSPIPELVPHGTYDQDEEEDDPDTPRAPQFSPVTPTSPKGKRSVYYGLSPDDRWESESVATPRVTAFRPKSPRPPWSATSSWDNISQVSAGLVPEPLQVRPFSPRRGGRDFSVVGLPTVEEDQQQDGILSRFKDKVRGLGLSGAQTSPPAAKRAWSPAHDSAVTEYFYGDGRLPTDPQVYRDLVTTPYSQDQQREGRSYDRVSVETAQRDDGRVDSWLAKTTNDPPNAAATPQQRPHLTLPLGFFGLPNTDPHRQVAFEETWYRLNGQDDETRKPPFTRDNCLSFLGENPRLKENSPKYMINNYKFDQYGRHQDIEGQFRKEVRETRINGYYEERERAAYRERRRLEELERQARRKMMEAERQLLAAKQAQERVHTAPPSAQVGRQFSGSSSQPGPGPSRPEFSHEKGWSSIKLPRKDPNRWKWRDEK